MPQLRHDDERCWKRRTQLEKRLIVGSSFLGLLALILIIIIALRKSCVRKEEECTSQFCVQAAAELLDYIDLKQDPCKDFYKYTCGTYYKNAVKKDSTSPWTSTQTLFENELKSLVVDPIKKKNKKPQIAMKQFYHACMNETAIDKDNNGKFMEAMDKLGGWQMINGTNWNAANFDWVEWYIKAKQMGLPVIGFFGFKGVVKDGRVLLRVTGPELDFDSHYTLTHFTKMMKAITQAFDAPHDNQTIREIHALAEKIFPHRADNEPENIPEDDDDDDDRRRKRKRGIDDDDIEIEEEEKGFMIGTIKNLTHICPSVPWLKILKGISGNPSKFNDSSDVVYYADNIEPYCKIFSTILRETHPRVIANYYIWTIIQNAHKYMDKDIRRVYQDYDDEEDDRFKICIEATENRFKYLRETVYVREKTTPQVKEQLQEMIDIMKELYIEHLGKCDWMDEGTIEFAIEKVHKITSLIGADDELYDKDFDKYLGVDGLEFTSSNMFKIFQEKMLKETHHIFDTIYGPEPEDWASFFKNAVEVNAFFLPLSNMMIIPAPILISIFYNKNFPAFMNYGFMGSTVGHEFMHGFSKDAREVVWENGTQIDWWTNATADGYDKKIQCVIDEYEGIPFRYRLNGTLTLNENVADYVGADLGYEAYKRYIKKHGVEKQLPGVPLTPEQIYWVKTSTNFCFRKLDDNTADYEEPDVHAIPAFRVMAPAKNSYYFAESFNCPVGTPMNPEKKCQVF